MEKELKKLIRNLEDQGWTVKQKKSGYMLYPPDITKNPVMIHLTASDRRAWANMLAELRRSGYQG
ncbi:hypothetical protein [uncultured Gulosibacter sp.]|uniref:hypothetical protein n=1 Tax=uncultured Gulosibacter sp. TaxID=1339167 RepID=UPI00288C5A0A|nr:hypothetical protein [uncultured Gulosibacter sp.]